jgi:acyl carrier protein
VVVAKPSWSETRIRAFCRERLAFVKVPRLIELRAALPRAAAGKVLRGELADVSAYLDGIRDADVAQSLGRLTDALPGQRRKLIRSIVRAQAGAVLAVSPQEIGDDRGFAALGMDSFAAIELRTRLEYLFGCTLPEAMTFDHPTVAAVVDYLLAQPAAARSA